MPRIKNLSLPVRVQRFIEKENLLRPGQSVLCGVSGGLDSMVLVEIFLELHYKPVVAHFNFGLRAEASELDEELVQNWAQKNQLPFFRNGVFKDHFEGKSIQEEARKLRYDWFKELAEWEEIETISLAHHADDQIETIFLQLLRGTGLAGMRGMLPKQEKLIRPLLFAHKKELKEFANSRNLEWREDASNEKSDYKRNKIRHLLVPMLGEISPGFEEVMLRNAERVRLHEEVSKNRFNELEKDFLSASTFDCQTFNWADIKGNPSGRFFIMEFLRLHHFNYSILDEIWDSIFSTECKQWKNGDGQTIELKGNDLLFWFSAFEHTQLIIAEPGQYKFGNNQLLELKIVTYEHFEEKFVAQNEVYLDYSKIKFPLMLLTWETGDEIAAFGLKGKRKKISDLLTDRKMSLEAKKRVLKLQDVTGEIICLPGIEASFTLRIEKKTNKIARLNLKSIKSKL